MLRVLAIIMLFSSVALGHSGRTDSLEFIIHADKVRGTAQVFSSSFAFGTYPMQVIQ